MHTCAVIPARYASQRFPAKALAKLCGKALIQHVYEAVVKAELFDMIIVATDHPEIAELATGFGAMVKLTSSEHQSGSDRIAEAVQDISTDLIFNIQGDEPLIDSDSLQKLKASFDDPSVQVASLMSPITDLLMLPDPNTVKVITDCHSNAIYFSRSAIPYVRDHSLAHTFYRHIGVYAYTKAALLSFVSLPLSKYEALEKLEQLRMIENGIPIRMITTDYQGIGVDTPEDLYKVEQLLAKG